MRRASMFSAAILGAAALLPLSAVTASAEIGLGAYLGWNGSFDSDVTLIAGGPPKTFFDVAWAGVSFEGPIYYGYRLTYWSAAGWGVMVDLVHAKIKADPAQIVAVSTGGSSPLSDAFERLEATNGLNLLTVSLMMRTSLGDALAYAGIGAGLSIPHIEVTGPGLPTVYRYQVTGAAAQVLVGIEYPISKDLAVFGEYRLSYAEIDAPLGAGTSIDTRVWTNHVAVGLSLRIAH